MSLRGIADGVCGWIDSVAEAILASRNRFRPERRVQLIEGEGETFSIRIPGADATSGSAAPSVRLMNGDAPATLAASLAAALRGRRVELVLRPNRFLFRPLELPKRDAEFLEGIVGSQLDRLTPCSMAECV